MLHKYYVRIISISAIIFDNMEIKSKSCREKMSYYNEESVIFHKKIVHKMTSIFYK